MKIKPTIKPTQFFHALNLGAGVQSTTLELMFRQGLIEYGGQVIKLTAAGFADTKREPQWVYEHLNWLIAQQDTGDGHPIRIVCQSDIGEDLMRGENSTRQRVASIPAFTAEIEGEKKGIVRRQCTSEYKIKVLERMWREIVGATPGRPVPKHNKLYLYYGISLDEASRATRIWETYHIGRPVKNRDGTLKYNKRGGVITHRSTFEPRFPLIDLQMTREDCLKWLAAQELPHPVRRSACVFCPFHSDAEWLELQRHDPDGWEYAVQIDTALREPGRIINRKLDQKLYLHDSCKPLTQIQFNPKVLTSKAIQTTLSWDAECAGMCGV